MGGVVGLPLVEERQPVGGAVVLIDAGGIVEYVVVACDTPLAELLEVSGVELPGVDLGRSLACRLGVHGVAHEEIPEGLGPLQTVGDDVVFPLDGTVIKGIGSVVGNGKFVAFGLLGGNQDDAIVCTRTVDGCRRCVLEDGDCLDIGRVHVAKAAFPAVNQHEGAAVARTYGIGSAGAGGHGCTGRVFVCVGSDIDATGVVCLTVGLDNVQTGNLSLKGTGDVGVRTVGHLVTVEVLDGTHELGLFQGTVTDDDRGFQHLGIVGEDEVDLCPAVNGLLNGLVAEELANQRRVGLGLDGIGAVTVSHYTVGSSLHHDSRADDRQAFRIENHTGYRRSLCEGAQPGKQGYECQRKPSGNRDFHHKWSLVNN